MSTELLQMSLSAAVTLRIAELRRLDRADVWSLLVVRRDEWVDLIASKSDILMFGGGKPGEVAKVHTALVEALAHMAFAPGGVEFLGLHFEVD